MYELTDDDVLVRFKEKVPVKSSNAFGFRGLFSVLAGKGLITSHAVEILQRIFKQVSQEPRFVHPGNTEIEGSIPPQPIDQAFNEMSRVLHLTSEARPKSLQHRLLLALLIYIFNFHNQPQPLPPVATPESSASASTTLQHPYLEILSKVALELSCPSNPSDPTSVTEREVTLWTMVAIGSASSFSPWRLEIPFMGHLIELMENDEDDPAGTISKFELTDQRISTGIAAGEKRNGGNLEKLTAYLRGYYLYGANKQTLRSLQSWKE